MKEIEQILKISEHDTVKLGESFKNFLNTKLILGQTRYVCRYGTLSDGHEKITDAQRYYQAIKEMWVISGAIVRAKAQALKAQADLLDAQEALQASKTESQRLRAQADEINAKQAIVENLVSVEDRLRMLDEYNKVRLELEPTVEKMYPLGIEQSEPDNWKAIAEYRMVKQQVPGTAPERLDNVPLDPITKGRLGLHYGRMDAIAPLMVSHREELKKVDNSENAMLEFINSVEEKSQLKELV